jgi:hypothetical protein
VLMRIMILSIAVVTELEIYKIGTTWDTAMLYA